MKAGRFLRFSHSLPIALLALAGQASAHPGDHGATAEAAGASSMLWHFLTSMDHIGPVIAAAALGWGCWRWFAKTHRS